MVALQIDSAMAAYNSYALILSGNLEVPLEAGPTRIETVSRIQEDAFGYRVGFHHSGGQLLDIRRGARPTLSLMGAGTVSRGKAAANQEGAYPLAFAMRPGAFLPDMRT